MDSLLKLIGPMPLRLVAIRQLSLYLPFSFGMKDEMGSSAQKPVPKDSGKGPEVCGGRTG